MPRFLAIIGLVGVMLFIPVSALGSASFPGSSALSDQSGQATVARPLTNDDVLQMLKAGVSPQIVIAKIHASPSTFDTSPVALESLKQAGTPDSVVLAMVQATPSQAEGVKSPPLGTHTVACAPGQQEAHLFTTPTPRLPWGTQVVSPLECGQKLTMLAKSPTGYRARTDDGKEGYFIFSYLMPQSSPEGVTGVRTLGYRITMAPWTPPPPTYRSTTTGTMNCDQEGMSTNCQIDMTQYTTQDNSAAAGYAIGRALLNQQIYIYNFAEGGGYFFAFACERKAAWSKCSRLVPGEVFSVRVNGDQMEVFAYKNSNPKKPEQVKYTILWVVPERK
jgi:hypothetical protein